MPIFGLSVDSDHLRCHRGQRFNPSGRRRRQAELHVVDPRSLQLEEAVDDLALLGSDARHVVRPKDRPFTEQSHSHRGDAADSRWITTRR